MQEHWHWRLKKMRAILEAFLVWNYHLIAQLITGQKLKSWVICIAEMPGKWNIIFFGALWCKSIRILFKQDWMVFSAIDRNCAWRWAALQVSVTFLTLQLDRITFLLLENWIDYFSGVSYLISQISYQLRHRHLQTVNGMRHDWCQVIL